MTPWSNPYLTNPYMPATNQGQPVMPIGYQQPVNGTTQVSGPDSALQYGRQLPPNSTSQALFDSNGKVFYIVTTDGAGTPTLETFDFLPHVEKPVVTDMVTRSEFDELAAKVNQIIGGINGIHGPVQEAGADAGKPSV